MDFSLVSTASACISEPPFETSVTGESDSSTATSVPVADIWIPGFLCKAYPVLYCGNDVTQVDRGRINLCEGKAYLVCFLDELHLVKLVFFLTEQAAPGMSVMLLIEHGITEVMLT